MRKLTDDLNVSEFEMLGDLPEKDRTKRFVLAQMRIQTSVIRNLAYPDQTVRHLKNIFAGPLERIIASQYKVYRLSASSMHWGRWPSKRTND